MKEIIASLTSKGQVTIPVEVRRLLGIKPGEKIAFVLNGEGTVQLGLPQYPGIAALRGAAGTLKSPLPWRKIREIAREDSLASISETTR